MAAGQSVVLWCQMMARPRSAARTRAALVGGQRRCGWSRSGPPITLLGGAAATQLSNRSKRLQMELKNTYGAAR